MQLSLRNQCCLSGNLFFCQIHSMITSCQLEEGMAFADIKQRLRGVSDAQIR